MANTNVQHEIHDWVRSQWLPQRYGKRAFGLSRVPLRSGGKRRASVSNDGEVVAVISTSQSRTATGKIGVGKLHHIFAEAYFLLLMDIKNRVIVLTDSSMYMACLKEKDNGMVPAEIEFGMAELPVDLAQRLEQSRRRASDELTGGT